MINKQYLFYLLSYLANSSPLKARIFYKCCHVATLMIRCIYCENEALGLDKIPYTSQIQFHPFRRRFGLISEPDKALATQLLNYGVGGMPSLIVTKCDSNKWLLLSGERHLLAAALAGIEIVPVEVRDQIDDKAMLQLIQDDIFELKLKVNPLEVAKTLKSLINQNMTYSEAGRKLGLAKASVGHYLKILNLHPEVRSSVSNGDISFGKAKAIARLKYDEQKHMLNQIKGNQLSVRAVEKLVAEKVRSQEEGRGAPRKREAVGAEKTANNSPLPKTAQIQYLENKISERISQPVDLDYDGAKVVVKISCFNADEFEGLMERLNVMIE